MKIVWSRRALAHLSALRDYIAEDNPQAAEAIAERILEFVQMLAQQPRLGRHGRIEGTREFVVPGTPYLVPYRVSNGSLQILAVFHGRQRRYKEAAR